jgi:ATP-dependent Lon protease
VTAPVENKNEISSLVEGIFSSLPVIFSYGTYYAPKGIMQPFHITKFFVTREKREAFKTATKKHGFFIIAFKKNKIHSKEIKSTEDIYRKGILVKCMDTILELDNSGLFHQKITTESLSSVIMSHFYDEVEITKYDPKTLSVGCRIVSLEPLRSEKEKEYKKKILDLIDRVLVKTKSNVSRVNDFSSIEVFEELLNSVFSYLVLSGFLAGESSYEKVREYFESDSLRERSEYIIENLEECYYSTYLAPFPIPLNKSGSSGMTAVRKNDKARFYRDFIQGIENISDDIRKELLDKVAHLENLKKDSSTRAELVEYLNTITSIPWDEYADTTFDLEVARKKLDEMQFGVEKAKERLIEYLALNLNSKENRKGALLCLIGPPGVGKTHFAQSVAKAIGRKYSKISLGGIDDVTILRGMRKGWIGAEPGQIIKTLTRTKSMNPVLALDEIDKIEGLRADQIKAALMEILDPIQNTEFRDAYLDIPVDISGVLFIATANYLSKIPVFLRDRIELLEIEGYTPNEKEQIAKHFLIPKIFNEYNIEKKELKFNDSAIDDVIDNNRRDAGMRGVEKDLRKISRRFLVNKFRDQNASSDYSLTVRKEDVDKYVDVNPPEEFNPNEKKVGVINILWVSSSLDTILYGGRGAIQVNIVPGKGKHVVTGSLMDVFKESIDVAIGFIRSNCDLFDIPEDFFDTHDLLLHAPSTAQKKEGPSAGQALVLCMLSAIKNLPIDQGYGFTGEVDLNGNVLEIGGLKSKIVGGFQSGIESFIVPYANKIDFERDVDKKTKEMIKIHFVKNVFDSLKILFPDLKIKK